MSGIPDPKAKEIVEKISNDNGTDRALKNFKKFLIDFGIVSYTVAVIIALAFNDFIKDLTQYFINKKKIKHPIVGSFITLLLALILMYLFVHIIFFKFVYTTEVAEERKIEQAIQENETEKIKKELDENKVEEKIHVKDDDTITKKMDKLDKVSAKSDKEKIKAENIELDNIVEGFTIDDYY